MTSLHITAASTKELRRERERERERDRERLNVSEKEKEKTSANTERARDLGIFSMMRFDSTTSTFLNLLVTKSYRKKLKVRNSKEKFPHFAVKYRFKIILCLWIFSCNPSARFEKLRWPVRIVKLRKEQKYSKIFRTVANFNKILQKLVIIISSEHHSIV